MAFSIDPTTKRITLDKSSVTAKEIYVEWVNWVVLSDNAKYPIAFISTGGDDLGGGISIPPYYFLSNGWRVRPMESSHTLTVTGNLFVDGGGDPIVPTLGNYNVLIRSVVPVQAQGIATGGGSGGSYSGPSASDIASAVDTVLAGDFAVIQSQISSAAQIASAVRTELALELAKIGALTNVDVNNVADTVKLKIQTYLDKLDATVSSRVAAGSVVDSNIRYINGTAIKGTGAEDNPWSPQ